MLKPIRLGIIGAGLVWKKAHKGILENLNSVFSIKAFCVSSQKRKDELQDSHPGVSIYLDYNELVLSPEIDAVLILTPIALNATVSFAALNAGKDVFVEKPLATNSVEAQKLVDLAKLKNKRLFVLENAFYDLNLEIIRNAIQENQIGDLVIFDKIDHGFIDNENHDAGGYGKTLWRQNADFPLGMIFDGGIHAIASNARIFGNPISVYATGTKIRQGFGEFDEISMLFQYPNKGVRGFFSFSGYMSSRQNYFNIRGTEGLLKVEGKLITIEKNNQTTAEIPKRSEWTQLVMWNSIVEAIRDSKEPLYTAQQAVIDIQILEAVEKSIKTGQPVLI